MASTGGAATATETFGLNRDNRFYRTMARHPELGLMLFAVLISLFSKLSNSTTKQIVLDQPPPRRFFPPSSPVLDFPYGNLHEVGDLLVGEEVMFVMYYAPWCAQSMRLRWEFEKAARYLQNEIQFVAINCWNPGASCRKQNNFVRYPMFFFYHTTLDGYRYTGHTTAEHLVHFVERMMHPYSHIRTQEEMALFLAERDNVMMGFFDFNASPQPPGFLQFYFAAMRTREKDPANPIDFGLMTDRALASSFELTKTRTIFLARSLNTTLRFPVQLNLTCSNLVHWCLTMRQPPVVPWVQPAGVKSMTLTTHLDKGPSVILFSRYHPLSGTNYYHSLLREVAMDYMNCKNSSLVLDIVDSGKFVRWHHMLSQLELREKCQEVRDQSEAGVSAQRIRAAQHAKRCCMSLLVGEGYSRNNACDVCMNYHQGHPDTWLDSCSALPFHNLPSWDRLFESFVLQPQSCVELMVNYNPTEFLSMCCDNHSYYRPFTVYYPPQSVLKSTTKSRSTDPFIVESVRDRLSQSCSNLRFQRRQGWIPVVNSFTVDFSPREFSNFTGFGCQGNRTLQFVAMDTRWSSLFAQRLGMQVDSESLMPSMVLFDKEDEAQYLFNTTLTREAVVNFVQNFTTGFQLRHFKSATLPEGAVSSHSHCLRAAVDNNDDLCVVEVTGATFQEVVMDQEMDVVLLYYAPWCGFCAGFAHIYLSLVRYFRNAKNIVFARINGDANDLPWEFTAESYPTITIYPAHRKEDSVTFPDHLHKSLPNLIRFVLRYGPQSLKLETGLSICSKACIQSNLQTASSKVHHFYGDLFVISQRLSRIKDRLGEYERLISKELNQTRKTAYEERSQMLEWYMWFLEKKRIARRLQQQSARLLYKTLLSTHGFHIEKHKLTGLLHKYHIFKEKLNEINQVDGEELFGLNTDLGKLELQPSDRPETGEDVFLSSSAHVDHDEL